MARIAIAKSILKGQERPIIPISDLSSGSSSIATSDAEFNIINLSHMEELANERILESEQLVRATANKFITTRKEERMSKRNSW